MSLKFLNLKGWHPSNKQNQKRIWVAEQKAKNREINEKEAAREVQKQQDLQKFKKIAAAKGDRETLRSIDSETMEFMYAPPPGLEKKATLLDNENEDEDDAVKEFRRKVQRRSGGGPEKAGDSGLDVRRNLERYVGKKREETVTILEQVERFPMLKDAPVEGDYTSTMNVNFKPMGVQLRNVRCLRCGEWGHQSGDRECKLRDFNPHDAARQRMEDPVTYMKQIAPLQKQDLAIKKAALPLEMTADSSSGYSILPPEEGDFSDPEKEFLSKLSTKEKKLLLKKLKEQESGEKEKSKKKMKRRYSSSSDSSSETELESKRKKDSKEKKKKKKKSKKKH